MSDIVTSDVFIRPGIYSFVGLPPIASGDRVACGLGFESGGLFGLEISKSTDS